MSCGAQGDFSREPFRKEMQRENLRTKGFGGRYSHYFAGGFALWRCRNSIRRYSTAAKREFGSQFPLFPLFHARLLRRHSSCIQFSVPSRIECRQVTPCRASSASGTKAGTTSKTQDVEFLFLSQRPRLAAFGGSMAPKTPVLKLNRPFACKPPAAIASELTRVACAPFAKPQVAGLRHS